MREGGRATTWKTAEQRVAERATVAVRDDIVQDWIHRGTHVVQHSCSHTRHLGLTASHNSQLLTYLLRTRSHPTGGWFVRWSLTALLTQFRSYRAFKVKTVL